jgi:FkbM family methyltransferase
MSALFKLLLNFKLKNKSHIFQFDFFKDDNFIRRFILRKLLIKNIEDNKKNYPYKLAIINYDHVSNDIIIDGGYEHKYMVIIAEWLKSKKLKNSLFIDIGANLGNHTLFFSKYFKKTIAFEPHKKIFKLLQFNTEDNSNIKIFNFGLSDKNKKSLLYTNESNFGGSSQISNKKAKAHLATFRKFDDLKLKKHSDLIKIDVEHHEEKVLKGAQIYLKKYSPIILFESNGDLVKNGSTPVIKLLKKFNYKKFYSIENFEKKPTLIDKIIYLFLYLMFMRKKYIVPLDLQEGKHYNLIIAEK